MSGSILSLPQVWELEGGYALRLLSAREEMEVRSQGEALAGEERDRALCVNACLIARALTKRGKAVFDGGSGVLEALTAGQIADLARQWGEFDRRCNPSAWEERAVEQAKKGWSTRLASAFSGACSRLLGRCPPRRGPGR